MSNAHGGCPRQCTTHRISTPGQTNLSTNRMSSCGLRDGPARSLLIEEGLGFPGFLEPSSPLFGVGRGLVIMRRGRVVEEKAEADAGETSAGIVVTNRHDSFPGGGDHPRIAAFIWGGKVRPAPTLPFGRWKGAA